MLIICFFHPYPHIPGPDRDVPGPQLATLRGLAADQDIPMLQHRFWGLTLEIHQREQAGAKPLRTEDQFILFTVEAQIKGRGGEGQLQRPAAFSMISSPRSRS